MSSTVTGASPDWFPFPLLFQSGVQTRSPLVFTLSPDDVQVGTPSSLCLMVLVHPAQLKARMFTLNVY